MDRVGRTDALETDGVVACVSSSQVGGVCRAGRESLLSLDNKVKGVAFYNRDNVMRRRSIRHLVILIRAIQRRW